MRGGSSQSIGPCPFCRSTKYKTTDTGHLVCEFGHQSQSFWQEEQDDNDANLSLNPRLRLSKRSVRGSESATSEGKNVLGKRKAEESFFPDTLVRYGEVEKFELFLAFQFLLKAQMTAVSSALRLSDVQKDTFEAKVKELWLAYVSASGLDYEEESISVPASENHDGPDSQETPSQRRRQLAQAIDITEDATPNSSLAPSRSNTPLPGVQIADEESFSLETLLTPSKWSSLFEDLSLPATLAATQPQAPTPLSTSSFIKKKTVSVNNCIAILYLALLQCPMDEMILMADLVRMICQGIIPYHDVKHLIPPKLMSMLESRKWDILFKAKPDPVPSSFNLEVLAMKMARALNLQIAVPLESCFSRLCHELTVPHIFRIPMMRLYQQLSLPLAYGIPFHGDKYPISLILTAAAIFFLKMIYYLDQAPDTKHGTQFSALGLPTASDLCHIWKLDECKYLDYRRITLQKIFPTSHFDEFIKFLTAVGVLKTLPDEEGNLMSFSFELHCYDDAATVSWMNVPWSESLATLLKKMRKNWTDSLVERDLPLDFGSIENLNDPAWLEIPESYRYLLFRCCKIIDCDMGDLLMTINSLIEKSPLFRATINRGSSSKTPSRTASPRPPSNK